MLWVSAFFVSSLDGELIIVCVLLVRLCWSGKLAFCFAYGLGIESVLVESVWVIIGSGIFLRDFLLVYVCYFHFLWLIH